MHKQEHSDEQDRRISAARRRLSELMNKEEDILLSDVKRINSDLSREQIISVWSTIKSICGDRYMMRRFHRPSVSSTWEPVSITQMKTEYYGCPSKDILRQSRTPNFEELELAVEKDQDDRSFSPREPLNSAQLVRDSQASVRLAAKMLERASKVETPQEEAADESSFYEALKICEEAPPTYSYRFYSPVEARAESMELNRTLRDLIASKALSLKEKIGRICFNILVCRHSPNTYTYNTLIVAFDKCRLSLFSDAVIWSFFNERLLRPSLLTFCAVINHFRVVGNRTGFLYALSCIAGLDSRTGGKWRRRHIGDVEEHPRLLCWAWDTRERTLTGAWVWQHIPLTTLGVELIISGLLDFEHFLHAVSLFTTCLQRGIRLNTKLIKRLFDECIDSLDFGTSLVLIRNLAASGDDWIKMMMSNDDNETNSYLVSRLYVLLDICGLRPKSSNKPLGESLLKNVDVDRQELETFLNLLQLVREYLPDGSTISMPHCKRLQLEAVRKECDIVAQKTREIEWKLLDYDHSIDFRIAMAIPIAEEAIRQGQLVIKEFNTLMEQIYGAKPSSKDLHRSRIKTKTKKVNNEITMSEKRVWPFDGEANLEIRRRKPRSSKRRRRRVRPLEEEEYMAIREERMGYSLHDERPGPLRRAAQEMLSSMAQQHMDRRGAPDREEALAQSRQQHDTHAPTQWTSAHQTGGSPSSASEVPSWEKEHDWARVGPVPDTETLSVEDDDIDPREIKKFRPSGKEETDTRREDARKTKKALRIKRKEEEVRTREDDEAFNKAFQSRRRQD